MQIPHIPADAPFGAEQRVWLGGFMAGLNSRLLADAQPAAAAGGARPVLDILFGTQTGTSEALAEDAAKTARSRGWDAKTAEMDAITPEALAKMENALFIVSTYGEGEMPDNAQQFWDALAASTAPRMESLSYGVLALGDTSYEHFCQAGKLVDTRLEQLGARRLAARVDCDVDYEDAAADWIDTAIPQAEGDAGAPVQVAPQAADGAKEAKAPAGAKWNRKNPYVATMVDNRVLSGPDSAKEIRHLAFALGDSGLAYEAGDALGVMPVNDPGLVQAILERVGASAHDPAPGREGTLGEALTSQLEIMTPARNLLREIEPLARHDELTHVTSNGDKEALEAFLWGKDTLDVLNLNPDLEISPEQLMGWLKPLQHRAYSISSSPKAHPGEVHLTVAAVRWMGGGRMHKGVASTFLADHVPEGASAGIFMSPNKSFRVPQDDAVPMIMVGPGTGVAPFRAFLEERRERGAAGTNWLFFGDQHRASDFIYEDEITAMSESGLLTRLDLAFSRDQAEKIYVQHRMLENGKDLFAMLEEGGHFYVCGDATRMAKDVDRALHEVIATHGAKSEDEAAEYVNALRREKRYVRDVY